MIYRDVSEQQNAPIISGGPKRKNLGQELMFFVVKVSGHRSTNVGEGSCDRTPNMGGLWFDQGIRRRVGGYNFFVKGSAKAWSGWDGEIPIDYRGAVGH